MAIDTNHHNGNESGNRNRSKPRQYLRRRRAASAGPDSYFSSQLEHNDREENREEQHQQPQQQQQERVAPAGWDLYSSPHLEQYHREEKHHNHNHNHYHYQQQQQDDDEEGLELWEELHCRTSGGTFHSSNQSGVAWEPVFPEFLPRHEVLSLSESIETSASAFESSSSLPPEIPSDLEYCAEETIFRFQHVRYSLYKSNSPSSTMPLAFPLHQQHIRWRVNCCDLPQMDTNYNLESFQPSTVLRDLQDNTSNSIDTVIGDTLKLSSSFCSAAVAQIVLSSVSCALCVIIILAITIPLTQKEKRNGASTYNLYLVFLAIPDLVFNAFLVYLFAVIETWTTPMVGVKYPLVDHPFDGALFEMCTSISLYLNAIVAHEIEKLLRNSKRRKRSKAPTLQRATLQAGIVYVFGITVFLVDYYVVDLLEDITPECVKITIFFIILVGIPILYMLSVCFRIYRDGLFGDMQSMTGKRLAVLVSYFTRIILVYVVLYIPIVILYTFRFRGSPNDGIFYYIASVLYSLQVWVSFGLSLTKPDVRKNVLRLFTFHACRKRPSPPEKPLQTISKMDLNQEEDKSPVAEDQISAGDGEEKQENVFYFDGDDAPVPRDRSNRRSSSEKRRSIFDLFMDDESARYPCHKPDTAPPKVRRRWIEELRKNIRDLTRLINRNTASEELKEIYRQSIRIQSQALHMASCLYEDLASNDDLATDDDSIGSSDEEEEEGVCVCVDISSQMVVDSMITEGIPHHKDGEIASAYTRQRWIAEVNRNIEDLCLQLEKQKVIADEGGFCDRWTIGTQRRTLATIRGFNPATYGLIFDIDIDIDSAGHSFSSEIDGDGPNSAAYAHANAATTAPSADTANANTDAKASTKAQPTPVTITPNTDAKASTKAQPTPVTITPNTAANSNPKNVDRRSHSTFHSSPL